jgi:TPR repeat protein
MPPLARLARRLAAVLMLALTAPAQALIPPTSCATPADPDTEPGDQSLAYWAQQPPSSTMCAYGYWAEKCGDHATALTIFDQCIEAGFVGAMIWKALMLESGSGMAQDITAAAALMRRAAHSDDPDYATLGKLHWATALYLGKGVERDEAAAMRWFREAAAEGDADAQEFLATGNHTADRDLQARSVASQRAAGALHGQRLAPVSTPPVATAPAPGDLIPWLAVALVLAGALARAWPRAAQGARA